MNLMVLGNGKCGRKNRLPNGKPGQCDGTSDSPCCSPYGFCGIGDDFCCDEKYGCKDYRPNGAEKYFRDMKGMILAFAIFIIIFR